MVQWITCSKGVLVTIMSLEETAQERGTGLEEAKGRKEMQDQWTTDEK